MFRGYRYGATAQPGLALIKAQRRIATQHKGYLMDNSSRNIVKFIVTITAAAMVIMAARFYAESQKEPMPTAPKEQPVKAEEVVPPPAPQPQLLEPVGSPLPAGVGEDSPSITGEPSVDIAPGETDMQESSTAEPGE
jgi:hypothetical protein